MPRPPDPRRDLFWELQDFTHGHGLEIGPLHRPTLFPDEVRVQYVDVFTADHLREFYASHPAVLTERIPEIDFVLLQDGTVRRLDEATAVDAPYDWVVASHVIEHVPDLIDWLAQIATITADDGALLLAVPDRRYTFDLHRPLTSVGQILQAHDLGDDRPSARAVFDHFRSHVTVPSPHLWAGNPPPGYDGRTYSLEQTLRQVERRKDGEYVDAHVWVFTPDSFLAQLSELRRLGHSAWYVESLLPTPRDTLEFLVRLRRIPRGTDATLDPVGELNSSPHGPDWVVDLHDTSAQNRRLRRRVQRLRREIKAAGTGNRRLRRRVQRLRRRVKAMEGSSRWRIGGAVAAVTAPLQGLARRVPAGRVRSWLRRRVAAR